MKKLVNGILQDLTEQEEAEFAERQEQALADAPKVLIADCTVAIQKLLDDKAKSLGYDSVSTAVTYADEPEVGRFQEEGKAMRKWRSKCWDKAYSLLDSAKPDKLPTIEHVVSLMPDFELGEV